MLIASVKLWLAHPNRSSSLICYSDLPLIPIANVHHTCIGIAINLLTWNPYG